MVDQILNRGENHEIIQQGAGREAEVLPGLLGIFFGSCFGHSRSCIGLCAVSRVGRDGGASSRELCK